MDEKNVSRIESVSSQPPSYEEPSRESIEIGQVVKKEGHAFKRLPKMGVHDSVKAFMDAERKKRKEMIIEQAPVATRVGDYLKLLKTNPQETFKFIQKEGVEVTRTQSSERKVRGVETVRKKTSKKLGKIGDVFSGKSAKTRRAFKTMMKAAQEELSLIPEHKRNLSDTISLLTEMKEGKWGKNILKQNLLIALEFKKIFRQASKEATEMIGAKLGAIAAEREWHPGASAIFEMLQKVHSSPEGTHVLKTNRALKAQYVKLYNQAINDTAEALTIANAINIHEITEKELLDSVMFNGKPEKLTQHCPNLKADAQYFNRIKGFVEAQILSKSNIKERAFEFEKWINVASRCIKEGDINSSLSIFGSLSSAPLYRLGRTQAKMSPKAIRQLAKLHKNYGAMKVDKLVEMQTAIWERPGSPIPYFGWIKNSLVAKQEGLKNLQKTLEEIEQRTAEQQTEKDGLLQEFKKVSERDLGRTDAEIKMNTTLRDKQLNEDYDKIELTSESLLIKQDMIQKYRIGIKAEEDKIANIIFMTIDLIKRAAAHLEDLKQNAFNDEIMLWQPSLDENMAFELSKKIEPKKTT